MEETNAGASENHLYPLVCMSVVIWANSNNVEEIHWWNLMENFFCFFLIHV